MLETLQKDFVTFETAIGYPRRIIIAKYVLRNYLAEVAIRKARDEKDYSEIERLRKLLARPFDEQPENAHYAALPPDWASHLEVSCSS